MNGEASAPTLTKATQPFQTRSPGERTTLPLPWRETTSPSAERILNASIGMRMLVPSIFASSRNVGSTSPGR